MVPKGKSGGAVKITVDTVNLHSKKRKMDQHEFGTSSGPINAKRFRVCADSPPQVKRGFNTRA